MPGQNGEYMLISPGPSPAPSPGAALPAPRAGGRGQAPQPGAPAVGGPAAGFVTPAMSPRDAGAPRPLASGSPAALARAAEVRPKAPRKPKRILQYSQEDLAGLAVRVPLKCALHNLPKPSCCPALGGRVIVGSAKDGMLLASPAHCAANGTTHGEVSQEMWQGVLW